MKENGLQKAHTKAHLKYFLSVNNNAEQSIL